MAKTIDPVNDAKSVARTSIGSGVMVGLLVGLWQGFNVNQRLARLLSKVRFMQNFFAKFGVAPILLVISTILLFVRKKANVFERFVYVAVMINSLIDVIKSFVNKGGSQ